MSSIIGFVVCSAVIFFAGKKLALYGDLIADKTGWGKAWIGLILMASVTSLPELMVGASSSAIVGNADLAVGDVLGSCAFNLAILAMLDIFVPRHQHLFFIASSSRHILSAALGLILIALAGLGLFLPPQIELIPQIGIMSLIFLVFYLVAIRVIFQYNTGLTTGIPAHDEAPNDGRTLKQLLGQYTIYAMVIIGAALLIPHFAENIAEQTGLGSSFVATIFIAASTSLPEVAVSVAAIKRGSVDLALSNLLGSNIFNILILAIDDLFYTKGILLKDASDNHIVTVFSCMIMTALAIAGFTYRAPKKKFLMAVDALLILVFYFISVVLLYFVS